jgi:LysR family transcriptional regulator, cyn operon transcriptional activator
MQPELRHLRYLRAVADHGNFTRAARDLHISQPTLSQQIQQLERCIGAQLLDRGGRSVRLTDAGHAYLAHARRALRELAAGERAVHDVRDLSRGHLRLAFTPTFAAYLVGPLVTQLQNRYPGITATVREMTQDGIETQLLGDELDLGIAFAQPHLPGVAATQLFAETLVVVVGTTTLAEPLTVDALERQPLALLTPDFATRDHIDAYFAQHRITPRIAVETNSIQALTEILRGTSLATVLPDAITREHPYLSPLTLDPPFPTRTVTLLTREGAYQTAANREFTHVIHDYVRAHHRGNSTAIR